LQFVVVDFVTPLTIDNSLTNLIYYYGLTQIDQDLKTGISLLQESNEAPSIKAEELVLLPTLDEH
jgi:hypothetical protein